MCTFLLQKTLYILYNLTLVATINCKQQKLYTTSCLYENVHVETTHALFSAQIVRLSVRLSVSMFLLCLNSFILWFIFTASQISTILGLIWFGMSCKQTKKHKWSLYLLASKPNCFCSKASIKKKISKKRCQPQKVK